MLSDAFTCSICFVQFDRVHRLPKMIPTCGHTICSSCLTDILRKQRECPTDRIKFPDYPDQSENFPVNYSLLKLLDENINGEYETCNKHGKPKHLVCTDDHIQICDECAAVNHGNHNVRPIKEVRSEAEDKRKKLEASVRDFEIQKEDIESVLKDSKKSLSTVLIKEFDKVRETIKEKEREVMNDIELFFECKREEIEGLLREDELLKDKYQDKITDLENKMNRRFFKALTKFDKIPDFQTRKVLGEVKDTEKNYFTALQNISGLVIPAITNIKADLTSNRAFNMSPDNVQKPKIDILAGPIAVKKFSNDDLKSILDIMKEEGTLTIICPTENMLPLPDFSLLGEITHIKIQINNEDLTDEYYQAIKYVYSQCENVSELNLSFNLELFHDGDLMRFVNDSYWATSKIEVLILNLCCSKVSDVSVTNLFTKSLAKMPNISDFQLNLNRINITDQSLVALASQFIPIATNLSKISLGLISVNISDSGIIELSKSLKQISKNLVHFCLDLDQTKIGDKSIQFFIEENLVRMNNLESLELIFCNTQITDQAFEPLHKNSISSNFQKIDQFFLDVQDTQITDKGVSILSKELFSKMHSLENLKFYVEGSSKVTDAGVRSFFQSLIGIVKTLKEFFFNFSKCKLTDSSVIYFATEVIPHMTALKVFWLNIGQMPITNKAIKELSKGLSLVMKNLQFLSLRVGNTKVNSKGIELIVDLVDLPSMPNLTGFSLVLNNISVSRTIQARIANIKYQLSRRSGNDDSDGSEASYY